MQNSQEFDVFAHFQCLHLRSGEFFGSHSQVLQSSSLKIPVLADGGFQFCWGFYMSILEPLRISRWCPAGAGTSINWALGLKHNDSCGKLDLPPTKTHLPKKYGQNKTLKFRDHGDDSSLKAGNFLTKKPWHLGGIDSPCLYKEMA